MGGGGLYTLPIQPIGTRAHTAVGQLGPMGTREKLHSSFLRGLDAM